jgi:hypothetical protein
MTDELPTGPLFSDPTPTKPAKATKAKAAELPEELSYIPGVELLSAEEVEAIRVSARSKIAADLKKAASKELEARFLKEERHRADPNEELIPLTIDLPGFADRVTIDGTVYMQGVTYRFPKRQYDSVRDQIAQSWRHEAQTGGANRDAYRQPRNTVMRPGFEGLTSSQLMRV